MQFNSYIFIFVFLPLTVVLYFLLNRLHHQAGKTLLIAAGILFYGWMNWSVLTVLLISIVLNYLFVRLLSRGLRWKKLFLAVPAAINVGLLVYFKYLNFLIWNLNAAFGLSMELVQVALPLGISFFTFQQIACLVSVYRGELKNLSLLDYLAFILYFPKLLMGPLMEPVDFVEQLNDGALKTVNWDHIACGIKIFCFGLLKKMLLADTFSGAVKWGFANYGSAVSLDWILITLCYTFEIYFDFSGYSDMATGVSLMLNITLPMNFDSPYKAVSIRDFWKRWHISLTKFLTKYIYIPLGGSRKGRAFTYLNTMIVFLISGLWHGANWSFLLWGALHGLLSVYDRMADPLQRKIPKPIRGIFTFGAVNALWLLFRTDSLRLWLSILKKMVLSDRLPVSAGLTELFVHPETEFFMEVFPALGRLSQAAPWIWMMLFLLTAFLICLVPENNYRRLNQNSGAMLVPALLAFLWSVLCLSTETSFVYFNF